MHYRYLSYEYTCPIHTEIFSVIVLTQVSKNLTFLKAELKAITLIKDEIMNNL